MNTPIFTTKKFLSLFSFLISIGILFLLSTSFSNLSDKTESEEQEKYSEIRIFAANEIDFKKMTEAGLIIDHANRKPGMYLDAWLSGYEISLLRNSGVPYQILVDDWIEYYNNKPKMSQAEIDAQMNSAKETDNVSHSIYGSMGGYLKYTEVVAKLDSMRAEYPQFISQKFSIGNTFQGRAMWTVRVTKNPDAPTGRPEVFYNALVHAREPESMETQMYYFYWLFENYGTDPVATYILDNREIYWLPVFNVDGYVYNETTNPNGGGMWRCNRHGNGSCGYVDINRNFGIRQFWNSSNGGSSTDSCSGGSGTYRGKSPFSEIETLNYMNFVNSRNFNAAFNAHTYGNYLIKPWAWSDPTPTPDDNIFNQFLSDMSETSGYTTGAASQTVGYTVRGGTDDWCYNDSVHTGHHIFGITPETGDDFWPPQSDILPFAQNMLYSNQYMSLIAGAFVNPQSEKFNQLTYDPGQSGNLKILFKNKGLLNASNVKIILTPVSAGLTIPAQQFSYSSINSFVSDSCMFDFSISNNVLINTALRADLKIKMDTVTIYSEQVHVLIGTGNVVINDNAETGFSNWTTNQGWAITTSQSNSPTHSFTDSPTGNYLNDASNSMATANFINVSSSPVTILSFYHKYTTESGYDFCNVEVSKNNDNVWQKVKSYNGSLTSWKYESFDITDYAANASQLKVRFTLESDVSVTEDGWYVDDIKILNYNIGPVRIAGNSEVPLSFSLEQNYPNPFNPVTHLGFGISKLGFVSLKIYDVLGKEVKTLVNEIKPAGYYDVVFDASGLGSGIYFYKLEAGNFTQTKNMLLVK